MKAELFMEYAGKQVAESEVTNRVKEAWTAAGNKLKDMQSMELYAKPETNTLYYVINKDFSGSFSM